MFQLLGSLPALLGLFNDLKATFAHPTEANVEHALSDIAPLVQKWFPNLPEDKLTAALETANAIVAFFWGERSAKTAEILAAEIVHHLPSFGVPVKQEHADAWIAATIDLLSDLGA